MLAYAVGFGGSMIWFGSSAGVALSNMYPEAKSVGAGSRKAGTSRSRTSLGFAILMAVHGWQPAVEEHRPPAGPTATDITEAPHAR